MIHLRILARRLINILLSAAAMIRFRQPHKHLILIGITGTDGKTTTTHLVSSILEQAGHTVGHISTLGAQINGQHLQTGLHTSTPGPTEIYAMLHQMKQAGVSHVVIETTSHGLDQYRTFGLNFRVGLITNLSPEHLDYHRTMDKYLQAKAMIIKQSQHTIINIDSPPLTQLISTHPSLLTISQSQPADLLGTITQQTDQSTTFNSKISPKLSKTKSIQDLQVFLPGEYNVSNALAATAIAVCLEVSESAIRQGLAAVKAVDGRWQVVQTTPYTIIIDFAHTPQSLAQVLPQAKKLVTGNGALIHVFGSAAQRDQSKRSTFGQLSGQWADFSILTMEDPRFESLDTIQSMIIDGLTQQGRVQGKQWQRLDDRQQAINQAIAMAQKGDVVLITGKGHEQSLAIQGQEIPWSDQTAVEKALGKGQRAKGKRQRAKGKN